MPREGHTEPVLHGQQPSFRLCCPQPTSAAPGQPSKLIWEGNVSSFVHRGEPAGFTQEPKEEKG